MKKKFLQGMVPGLALAIVIAGTFFIFGEQKVAAQFATASTTVADVPRQVQTVQSTIWDAVVKAGRVSFTNALRSVINQFAYDTATYIGSGAEGQKPVYFTEQFGSWLLKQGANAGGEFIEEFAKADPSSGEFIEKYNICSPDLSVSIKISLGLTDYANRSAGLSESRCNLVKIWESGRDQVEAYRNPNYLRDLAANSFEPSTTDVGAALTLFNKVTLQEQETIQSNQLNREESGGWLDITGLISGYRTAPPGENQAKLDQAKDLQTQGFFTQTGDIFVDAANIFLNQLALSAFNRLLDNLSRDDGSNSSSNYYAQGQSGGISRVARQNSTILQAKFNERTDYDILSQLSSCPNEEVPGPTNCVITQQFAQAINQKLTIAQAIDQDILDPNKRVGFDSSRRDMSYRDGYPYRSLIILRKYRILPVGWEVAAQYIKDNGTDITLGGLIDCFDPNDSYGPKGGEGMDWCQGLIDPNWLLKVPKQYCGMEGYGGDIINLFATPDQRGYCMSTDANCQASPETCRNKTNNQTCQTANDCTEAPYTFCNQTYSRTVEVTRSENYCADEQSCIKENPNGSCAYYGYCTEEKRLWTFGTNRENSCEARDNTCQTFQGENGQTISYLQNTLNFKDCNANQVGCQRYAALPSAYNAANDDVTWRADAGQRYFNKNVTACEASGEGCHEFVRIRDEMSTNLVADGSFELSLCVENTNQNEDGGESGETGEVQSRNPLIPTAHAQSTGACELQTLSASNYLSAPNNRWYIAVDSGTVRAGVVNAQASQGSNSLYIEGNGGIYSKDNAAPSLLPTGFTMEADTYYTLSANVYVEAGTARLGFGTQPGQYVDWNTTGSWKSIAVVLYNPSTTPLREFFIKGTGAGARFYVDQIQLTKGRAATTYSDYMSGNVIYQKLLPAYLESVCYTGSRGPEGGEFQFKSDAPAVCYQYARKCSANEVGCEAYTATDSGISVTGKVKAADACPGTCVGYNTYVQQANAFNARQAAYFIPQTARSCSAQSVGCTAFTNLDKLDQGGESVEYYTSMRACRKPDASACGQFYTWEGSDEAGYQLRVYSLQRNGSQPASTLTPAQEAQLCNAEVFAKLPTDPGYNYDCRQFYAADGTVSYHLYSKTISCSDDCHPYRREVASAAECTNGGGTWEAAQSRCIYNAIPGEGTTCSAPEVGCQEYAGNIASNTREVFSPAVSTFESVSNQLEGWRGGSRSNVSLNAGGHSLFGANVSRVVGEDVARNRSYVITFLAKSVTANTTIRQLALIGNEGQRADFTTTGSSLGTDWKLYTFNLPSLDHDVVPRGVGDSGELLRLEFSGQVYLDNIRLTEVPDRYYLIKNSWNTPTECDRDFTGASSPRYMLGCSAYAKTDGSTVTLRSFSGLCQDSAAGCEAMIDTRNSLNPKKALVNDANNNGACDQNETDCVETPADGMINVVYDPTKQCGQANKGCQRFGVATTYDNQVSFGGIDAYLKNDPDQYGSTVCTSAGVGCSQWSDGRGSVSYFKDPGNQACEWRLEQGTSNTYKWFQKQVMRCGGTATGAVCSDASQCAANQQCLLVNTDIPCPETFEKTLGRGGLANRVSQPSTWAGICAPSQSGCTEYIDPVSKVNPNLILNPSYVRGENGEFSDWQPVPNQPENDPQAYQRIALDYHTVYILKGDQGGTIGARIADCVASSGTVSMYRLNPATNTFVKQEGALSTALTRGKESIEFYLTNTNPLVPVTCQLRRQTPANASGTISLRQAIVEYQLAQNLDRQSANGLVSFNRGYILLNERGYTGSAVKQLLHNADATLAEEDSVDGVAPQSGGLRNANTIIKVQPDRVCSKWLSCNSSVPDPNNPGKEICLDMGLCDELDSEGKCAHPIQPPTDKNQNTLNILGSGASIANLTGYSKVGYRQQVRLQTDSLTTVEAEMLADYYNFANMKQAGEEVKIPNGGFEIPGGWQTNMPNVFRVVNQPQDLQGEQLVSPHLVRNANTKDASYLPPVGRGMGRLDQRTTQSPVAEQRLSLQRNKTYVISAYFYVKTGNATDNSGIRLRRVGQSSSQPLLSTASITTGAWYRQTTSFRVDADGAYALELFNNTSGPAYFDDVRIEAGLNIRCSERDLASGACGMDGTQLVRPENQQYALSSCRLYPTSQALDCTYTDSNGVISQGLRGYCLETDPKNPGTCLLWYPIGKTVSEKSTELPPIEFGSNEVYYCIKANTQCNAGTPQLFCEEFIKVSNDKYWYQRMKASSSFQVGTGSNGYFDNSVLYPNMKINFGNKYNFNNTHGIIDIPSLTVANNYFGAYLNPSLEGGKKLAGVDSNGVMNTYVPYWLPVYGYNFKDAGWTGADGQLAWSDPTNRAVCFGNNPPVRNDLVGGNVWTDSNVDSMYVLVTREVDEVGCNLECNGSNCTGCFTDAQWWPRNAFRSANPEPAPEPPNLNQIMRYAHSAARSNGMHGNVPRPVDGYSTSLNVVKSGVDDGRVIGLAGWNIKDFYMAQSTDAAAKVIQRLFVSSANQANDLWELWRWNPATSQYALVGQPSGLQPITQCITNGPDGLNKRPPAYTSGNPPGTSDYCYVLPTVSQLSITPVESSNGNSFQFEFHTKTDPEQLPIQEIAINLGYKNSDGTEKTVSIVRNAADNNPRKATLNIRYSDINKPANDDKCFAGGDPFPPANDSCAANTPCCFIKPTVKTTDNWGYWGEATYTGWLKIEEGQ